MIRVALSESNWTPRASWECGKSVAFVLQNRVVAEMDRRSGEVLQHAILGFTSRAHENAASRSE